MSDFTIACNEETNPFYYIVRPNTKDAKQIFKEHIYGSLQTVGHNAYAIEQSKMINLAGFIHTHKLSINYLHIREKINDR